MNNTLKTQISLLLSKYENIETVEELISLLNKEFKTNYNDKDLLNHYTSLTELEIANREIYTYGHFNECEEYFGLQPDN